VVEYPFSRISQPKVHGCIEAHGVVIFLDIAAMRGYTYDQFVSANAVFLHIFLFLQY